jgi:superfamily II DNA or RNA helicase
VFNVSVGDLAGRWLADFDLVVLRLALTPAERLVYDREIEIFRRAYRQFRRVVPYGSWADFVAAASRSAEGQAALEAWRTARALTALTQAKRRTLGALLDRHRSSKVLVFTGDNESAYSIARERFVMPITCDISRKEREEALAAFRAGELRVLVSSRVLNEGVDVPDADVAIVVGGTHGEREHVQRVGRILRPSPGKRAIVYELVASGTSEVRRSDERRQRLVPEGTASVHAREIPTGAALPHCG